MTTHKRKTSKMLGARQSRKIFPANGMANTNTKHQQQPQPPRVVHVWTEARKQEQKLAGARVDDEVAHKHTNANRQQP